MIVNIYERRQTHFLITAVIFLVWCAVPGQLAADETPDRRPTESRQRVMIVTGEDYEGHRWQETAPLLKAQLAQDPRLAVEVTEDLLFLRAPQIHDYDVVMLHFKNYDAHVPGYGGFDNLAKFVKDGGGLVLVHFACGAFQEFRGDFVKLGGRVWNPELRGHDPYGRFAVEIVEEDHPITRGLDGFETTDELYTCLDGKTPITLLAQARSKVDKQLYPIAFVLHYGNGRVFHTPLGHDVRAFGTPGTMALIRRGTAWASGLNSQPPPTATSLESVPPGEP